MDGLELVSPKHYAEAGYPHEVWTRLRREDPVAYFDPPGYRGFWAITKHSDIAEISKQPDKFLSAPRLTIAREELERMQNQGGPPPRTLVNMDPPEHREYRKLASPWFTPRNLRILEERMEASARELVDKLMATDACDFVSDVAALHPLRLIAHLFGVAEEDEPFVLKATNEIFGGEDPEFQRTGNRLQDGMALWGELLQFFAKISADRKANPRDDLASVLANAEVGGNEIGGLELFGYYLIVLTAGHETTRNAISGGMLALIEHPDALRRLQEDPALCATAADEIIRWTTPVNHFVRTAASDYELRGQQIKEGDSLALFYASANRDEEVFDAPFEFRVDRDPNPHLAFGIGEHFCLGANLARMEIRVLLAELLPRLVSVELGGPPERLASSFVGGVKHLPIRYEVGPAVGGARS
ncbi:MAG: cytochrome P450 [Myxococcota bacterium]